MMEWNQTCAAGRWLSLLAYMRETKSLPSSSSSFSPIKVRTPQLAVVVLVMVAINCSSQDSNPEREGQMLKARHFTTLPTTSRKEHASEAADEAYVTSQQSSSSSSSSLSYLKSGDIISSDPSTFSSSHSLRVTTMPSASPSSSSSSSSSSSCCRMFFKSLHPLQETRLRFFYPRNRVAQDEKQNSAKEYKRVHEIHDSPLEVGNGNITGISSSSLAWLSLSSPSRSPPISDKNGRLGNDLKAERMRPYSQNKSGAAILNGSNDDDDDDDFQNGGFVGNVDDGDYAYYGDANNSTEDLDTPGNSTHAETHVDNRFYGNVDVYSYDDVLLNNYGDSNTLYLGDGGDDDDARGAGDDDDDDEDDGDYGNTNKPFKSDSLPIIYYDDDDFRYSDDDGDDDDDGGGDDDVIYNDNDDQISNDEDYMEVSEMSASQNEGRGYDDDDGDGSDYIYDKESSPSQVRKQRNSRHKADSADLEIRKSKRYLTSPSRDTYEVNISVVVITTWLAFVVALATASCLFVRLKAKMVARCQSISMRGRNRGKVACELDTIATISHHQLL